MFVHALTTSFSLLSPHTHTHTHRTRHRHFPLPMMSVPLSPPSSFLKRANHHTHLLLTKKRSPASSTTTRLSKRALQKDRSSIPITQVFTLLTTELRNDEREREKERSWGAVESNIHSQERYQQILRSTALPLLHAIKERARSGVTEVRASLFSTG